MKTSININLFGTVYAIDEDAHNLLDQYLTNLKSYFSKQEGGDEISDDIEHRIAELFWELKQQGNESISIEQVTEILHKIGNPEEMENAASEAPKGESTTGEQPKQESQRTYGAAQTEVKQGQRRFYRDGRDRVLGGVLSGICHYFGWNEPLLLRILFILLCLFTEGIFIFLYILLWIIAPKAVSAEQRLMMQGKAVNPDSIKSEVLDGATTGNVPANNHSGCLKAVLGVLLAPFGCVALFVLFILGVVLFGLLMGAFGALTGIVTGGSAVVLGLFAANRWSIVILVICVILAIALPIYLLYRWFHRDSRALETTSVIIIVGCWLLAVIFGSYYGHDLKQKVGDLDWPSIVEEWDNSDWDVDVNIDDQDSDQAYDSVLVDAFERINFEGVGKLKFTQGDSCAVEVSGNEWMKRHTMISANDGVLNVVLDDQARRGGNNKGLKIKVTAPCLTMLSVQGVGSVEVEGELRQEKPFEMKMEGVGSVEIDKVICPRVSAEQQGVGKTEIDVDTDSLFVKIDGVGKMEISGRTKNYQRNATEFLSTVDDKDLKIGE